MIVYKFYHILKVVQRDYILCSSDFLLTLKSNNILYGNKND